MAGSHGSGRSRGRGRSGRGAKSAAPGGRSSGRRATSGRRSSEPPRRRAGRRTKAARVPLRHRLPRIGDEPGDRLIAIGVVIFGIGMLAVLAVFLPFSVGVRETGLLLGLATMLTVIGLGCALIGLYQQAKPRR